MRLQTRRSGTASLSARFNQEDPAESAEAGCRKAPLRGKVPPADTFPDASLRKRNKSELWQFFFFFSSFQSVFWMSALLLVELEMGGDGGVYELVEAPAAAAGLFSARDGFRPINAIRDASHSSASTSSLSHTHTHAVTALTRSSPPVL